MKILADDLVRALVGVHEVTGKLRAPGGRLGVGIDWVWFAPEQARRDVLACAYPPFSNGRAVGVTARGAEEEGLRAARLQDGALEIYRSRIYARWSARLQAPQSEAQCLQALGKAHCRLLSSPAAGPDAFTSDEAPPQRSAGGEDYSPSAVYAAQVGDQPGDRRGRRGIVKSVGLLPVWAAYQEPLHQPLLEGEVRLALQGLLHGGLVELLIKLSPQGLHSRSLARIEAADLNSGAIRVARHLTPESVDLTHQMPFGWATDGRIARSKSYIVQAESDEQRAAAHPCRR